MASLAHDVCEIHVAGRVGAVIEVGRGDLRPLFLLHAMATFDGMATASIR